MLDASAKQGILKPIRLVLVDRQPIVLQGLKSILGTQQDFDVVASTSDGTSCLEAIRNLSPDVALIADTLPDLTTPDILAIAKAERLSTRLVFFTESDTDHDLTAAIAAGACSAISKYAAPGTMLRSLRLMTKSGVSLEQSDLSLTGNEADGGGKLEKMLELLTPRERQIGRLVAEGMSNKEIARRLDVSQGTVKVHLYNIFQKLEITNRTVLATISLLQRTSGFGALALAFVVFAIADELKASEANDMFAHDDGRGHTGEHAGYEVWKKAILQRLIVSESAGTPPFTEKDLLAKASQVTTPAAAMEALRAAEQFLGSKPLKDGSAVGSSTPSFAALLLRGTNDTPAGGAPPAEDHLPRLASNPMSLQGGYGTFAALAGALIYALSDPHGAAQAHEVDQALVENLLAGIGDKAATKLDSVRDVDADRADIAAPHFLSHDSGPHSAVATIANSVTQESIQGQAGPDGAGHHLQTPIGIVASGHDSSPSGHSLDQLTGGSFEKIVDRSPSDSKFDPKFDPKSVSSDSVLDVASGPGRLNLAAFGALAWVHLTAATKSIPPHTLAWIYDPASNQTIVYVNPTDHILDVGDRGLLEVHLRGIVAIAEAEVATQPAGAAVAVTLEQLEQALISGTATEETALSANSGHASESSPGVTGFWSASADDGLSFQFAHVRTGSGTSAKSSAFAPGSADTTEESTGASGVPASGSSIASGHGSTPPAVENPTSKSEPTNPNAGTLPTTQNEIVPSVVETADNTDHGNSDHASDKEKAKGAAAETAEGESNHGNGVGKGNEHHSQAADNSPVAGSGGVEHGNSDHSAPAKGAKAGEGVATGGNTDHGNSKHAAEPGSAKAAATETAEAKSNPDNGNGAAHGNEHHSQAADSSPVADSGGVEHGNSDHSASAKGAKAGEGVATGGNTDHGNSKHAAEPGSAQAAATDTAEAKSNHGNGNGAAHGNEHHSQAADSSPVADSGGVEHGNSDHSAPAKGAKAGEGVATGGNTDHGNSKHAAEPGSAQAAATETAEAKSKPENGVGNDTKHHSQADDPPGAAKTAEPGGAEHGNSQHASEPATAKEVATEKAEAKSKPDGSVGHDNEHQSQAADAASPAGRTAEPAAAIKPEAQPIKMGTETGGADRDMAFRFDSGAASSTLVAAAGPVEPNGPHNPHVQKAGLDVIVQTLSETIHEPTAHHGNHDFHPGIVPAPHDLLI